jgi:hypothetical protein
MGGTVSAPYRAALTSALKERQLHTMDRIGVEYRIHVGDFHWVIARISDVPVTYSVVGLSGETDTPIAHCELTLS